MVGGAVPEGGIGTLVPSTPISIVVCRAVIYFPQHRPFNYMTLGDPNEHSPNVAASGICFTTML